eukprot:m.88003 g.88003  ORF g.88003 m.88003 type:complete len:229 (-) comp13604_c0_seq2:24-710(-)
MCQLLDDWGVAVQAVLGAVAFCILILKRLRENPRRDWRIWFFDASKQALAASLVHLFNVFFSDFLTAHSSDHDPCTWYFMNILLDSTLGLLFIYGCLVALARMVERYDWELLRSGDYGKPPQTKAWMWQMLVYVVIAVVEKVAVSALMLAPFWQTLGNQILRPLADASEKFETVFTMLLVPLVINAIWFWVVDNFLMKAEVAKKPRKHINPFSMEMEEYGSDEEDLLL